MNDINIDADQAIDEQSGAVKENSSILNLEENHSMSDGMKIGIVIGLVSVILGVVLSVISNQSSGGDDRSVIDLKKYCDLIDCVINKSSVTSDDDKTIFIIFFQKLCKQDSLGDLGLRLWWLFQKLFCKIDSCEFLNSFVSEYSKIDQSTPAGAMIAISSILMILLRMENDVEQKWLDWIKSLSSQFLQIDLKNIKSYKRVPLLMILEELVDILNQDSVDNMDLLKKLKNKLDTISCLNKAETACYNRALGNFK